jgi:hypothetical protein
MRFIRGEGFWQLVTGDAPAETRVIATLRTELEVLALTRFCEHYLADPGALPSRFEIEYQGRTYRVYFLGGSGEKLTLHIDGGGEVLSVVTEFVLGTRNGTVP